MAHRIDHWTIDDLLAHGAHLAIDPVDAQKHARPPRGHVLEPARNHARVARVVRPLNEGAGALLSRRIEHLEVERAVVIDPERRPRPAEQWAGLVDDAGRLRQRVDRHDRAQVHAARQVQRDVPFELAHAARIFSAPAVDHKRDARTHTFPPGIRLA